jgi:ribosomal protein S20
VSENKTSDAQKRATQAYRERNREKTRKQSARSAAKTFINKYADLDELEELKKLISERESNLKG